MRLRKGKFVWDKVSKKKVMVKEFKDGMVKVSLKRNGKIEEFTREPNQLAYLRRKNQSNKYFNMVKRFHKAFGHPVANSPTRLTEDAKKSRINWMQEELDEYKNAKTLHDEVDALIDLIYFVEGTLVEHGVKPDKLFEIVHIANMKKLFPDGKPRYDESGKVIKPEGWKAPDEFIKKEIERQIERSKMRGKNKK